MHETVSEDCATTVRLPACQNSIDLGYYCRELAKTQHRVHNTMIMDNLHAKIRKWEGKSSSYHNTKNEKIHEWLTMQMSVKNTLKLN